MKYVTLAHPLFDGYVVLGHPLMDEIGYAWASIHG
jgi:hypothetical protein